MWQIEKQTHIENIYCFIAFITLSYFTLTFPISFTKNLIASKP